MLNDNNQNTNPDNIEIDDFDYLNSDRDLDKEFEDLKQSLSGDEKAVKGNSDVNDSNEDINDQQQTGNNSPDKADDTAITGNTVNSVVIDDNYISNQLDDNIKRYLEGIKGEMISPKALKNYLNAQSLIDQQKAVLSQQRQPDSNTQSISNNANTNQGIHTEYSEKVQQLALQRLKDKYRDIPSEAITDKDVFKDYMRDKFIDDPLEANSILNDLGGFRNEVENTAKYVYEYSQNWEKAANDTMAKDINDFKDKLTKLGLKPEDLGIDLSLDANGNNEYLKNQVLTNNGNVDPNIVGYVANYPKIKQGAILQKLLTLNVEKIVELKATGARREGYEARNNQQPPPSQSANNIKQTVRGDVKLPIDVDDMSIDELDSEFEKVKQSVVGVRL